jgi:hypothetical protein
MNEIEVFILADKALNNIVQHIRDDQWDLVMPDDFATTATGSITLREVINYHAYDDAWVPDMLSGKYMKDVGIDEYKGDLLGTDPKRSFALIVEKAVAAAEALDDLDKIVHCSFGDYKAREYLWQITSFRGLRVHDIAKVIAINSDIPDDLAQGLWDQLAPVADEWRTYGVFGPKIEVPEDASLQDRLLALTGRQPYGY